MQRVGAVHVSPAGVQVADSHRAFVLQHRVAPGGLDETVTDAVLHAAFLPFGDIKDVSVPLDQGTQKNRGFGFVTFQEACVPVPNCAAAVCGSACLS